MHDFILNITLVIYRNKYFSSKMYIFSLLLTPLH